MGMNETEMQARLAGLTQSGMKEDMFHGWIFRCGIEERLCFWNFFTGLTITLTWGREEEEWRFTVQADLTAPYII